MMSDGYDQGFQRRLESVEARSIKAWCQHLVDVKRIDGTDLRAELEVVSLQMFKIYKEAFLIGHKLGFLESEGEALERSRK